jgi:hypothetical protein
MSYLFNSASNVLAQTGPGTVHKFQTTTLEADHPAVGDSSNKVATTGWVTSLIAGVPMWPTVSKWGSDPTLAITVSDGTVSIPTGGSCNIRASHSPIAVNASSQEHVWIRYSDCQVVVSTLPVDPAYGVLIAYVYTNATTIYEIVNMASFGGYAQNLSPFLQGDPRAPHPPVGDNDNSIPTTKWVNDSILNFLSNGTTLAGLPQVVDKGGLKVNVTAGSVPKPGSNPCAISPLPTDLAVNASSTEYIWVRYQDCQVVASTASTNPQLGRLLATVVTSATAIISITQATTNDTGNTWMTAHYGVGFGGYLVYQPVR